MLVQSAWIGIPASESVALLTSFALKVLLNATQIYESLLNKK